MVKLFKEAYIVQPQVPFEAVWKALRWLKTLKYLDTYLSSLGIFILL